MNATPSVTAEGVSHVNAPALIRTIGLWSLIIYGVGDMLGAGIYALIGKAAGKMGNALWVAFAASMVAALLTGLSYASLGSRYPRAAGVAYITHRAFHLQFLSYIVGLAVMASGLTSFATQSRTFAGYFWGMVSGEAKPGTALKLTEVNPAIAITIILAFIAVLTFINFWGMREAIWLNILCTFVEVSGLLFIILIGLRFLGGMNYLEVPPVAANSAPGALSIGLTLQGAVLTFYAFIGFEDMLNVAEEVKNPRRNFPIAVMAALGITTLIYMAVSITAVSVVPYAMLGKSDQPLVDVVKVAAPWFPPILFSLIALFAITNTALVNYIMGSRLVYGMARQGLVPRFLGAIHPARRTPHWAILCLMAIVIVLAIGGDISVLAAATSSLLLTVFIIVNGALIVLQHRPNEAKGAFEIPSICPALGIIVCAAILFHVRPTAENPTLLDDPRIIAGILLAGIAALYFIVRPKNITEEVLGELD